MARTKRRKRAEVPGLTWRGGVAYWQREHERLPGKDHRVNKSLRTSDPEQAVKRATLLNRIGWERGDWDLIERWVAGTVDITDLIRGDRESDWKRLRRRHLDGVPFEPMATAYLKLVKADGSARTLQMYDSIVQRALDHFGHQRAMHEVTTAEAQAYLHADQGDGETWAPRTISTQRTVLAAVWDHAMKQEEEEADAAGAAVTIRFNPWRRTKAPKIRPTRFSYLRPEEARALVDHAEVRNTPTRALLATAIYAGLRLGELANLRTGIDVVLTNDWRTSQVIVQGREGEYAWEPKTERSTRKLRPIPALHAILRDHERRFAGDRYFFKPEGPDVPPHSSTVTLWVKAAYKSAGIRYGRSGEALTLHSLRHTFATWQVAAGIPLPTVAKRMGDTEIVVLRTYSHAMPEADDRADDVLQGLAEQKGAAK